MLIRSRKFQRMAETLLRVQRMTEAGGGEVLRTREELEDALERVGVSMTVARLMDPEALAHTLGGDAGKLWGVAEALYLDALLAEAEGRSERAAGSLRRAAVLFRRLEPGLDLPDGAVPPEERLREIELRTDGAARDGAGDGGA